MTFELSPQHQVLREKARALAASLRERAADIDRHQAVPDDVVRDTMALGAGDHLGFVFVVEELAVASAAVAIRAAALSTDVGSFGLTGLRGAPMLENSKWSQLVLAAAALGIGKCAVGVALDEIRRSTAMPQTDVEKPHWVVADAATDLDAARLITYKAARTNEDADIALARLMTSAAAQRAVDTAVRITGPSALEEGSVLERLTRDVRAVALVLGTEEHHRAVAADGLLPR